MTLAVRQWGFGVSRSTFAIGGLEVEVAGELTDISLLSSLSPFESVGRRPDIRIAIEWVDSLSDQSEHPVFDSGTVWRMYDCGPGFVIDFRAYTLGNSPYKRLLVDRAFRAATLQMNHSCFANERTVPCPLEYPLDELLIMHRLTQEKAIELHGTGIVRLNGESNLFVGHSGAGKSTTTRLWTEIEDVEVLSDDRIIVRWDADKLPQDDAAVEKAGILRLRDSSASRSNLSAQDDKSKKVMRMYGTPWHGEAMYASPNSAPLSRIFVLEHGHGNVITPLTPSQGVAELFARSFVPFHRHEYVDSALTFLQELVDSVPVYRYSFEPDQRAVEKIRNFHD
jgi:hypothetical protein